MGKSWYDFSPDNLGLESLLVCTQNQNRNYILQQENIVSLYCVWPSVFCWVLLVHNFKGSYYDELDFPWSLDNFFFFFFLKTYRNFQKAKHLSKLSCKNDSFSTSQLCDVILMNSWTHDDSKLHVRDTCCVIRNFMFPSMNAGLTSIVTIPEFQ